MKILFRAAFVLVVGAQMLCLLILVGLCILVSPIQMAVYYVFTGKCLGCEHSALDWSLGFLERFFVWVDKTTDVNKESKNDNV